MREYSPIALTPAGEERLKANEPLYQALVTCTEAGSRLEPFIWPGPYCGKEDVKDYYNEFAAGVLPRLSIADQNRSLRSIVMSPEDQPESEEYSGGGIVRTDTSDGLFPGAEVAYRLSETYANRLVLSGAAALELVNKHSDVLADADWQLTLDECRFAGAALAARLQQDSRLNRLPLDMLAPSFTLARDEGLLDVYVGADLNGDFRIAMQPKPSGTPVDPEGRPLDFYPAGTRIDYLGGYHSIEPDIMKDILRHALLLPDETERRTLIERMAADAYARVEQGKHYLGNFGDAGHNDGAMAAQMLAYQVQRDATRDRSAEYLVSPGRYGSLRLESRIDGIEFTQAGFATADTPEVPRLHIANDELPLLVTALLDQAMRGAGRTSAAAHLRILDTARQLATGVSPDTIEFRRRRA